MILLKWFRCEKLYITVFSTVFSAEVVEYDIIFCFLLLCHFPSLSVQTMLTAISMSAIATNGVVPGGWADAGTTQSSLFESVRF